MSNRKTPETEAPMRLPIVFSLRDAAHDSRRGKRHGNREQEHDRRMTEREKEADAERAAAFLQHESHRIVDRRDVVGVEGVAQSEHVGDEAKADQRGVRCRVVQVQAEARDVQEGDEAEETRQPDPLARGEGHARRIAGREDARDGFVHGIRAPGTVVSRLP